jgi:SAM-dependent methyltransferase
VVLRPAQYYGIHSTTYRGTVDRDHRAPRLGHAVAMGLYGERILPRLIDLALDTTEANRYRALAARGLRGTVVEVGFGSGLNVAHYPGTVERVHAVEPSARARRRAGPRIAGSPVPVELIGLDGQQIPLPDGSADAVLTTWTLCTIPDLDRALVEMRRVLKPEGRLHFLEHGLHPNPKVQAWQHRLDPIQKRLVGGCHLDRRIDERITGAGFTLDELTNPRMSGPAVFGYLYLGTATPAP